MQVSVYHGLDGGSRRGQATVVAILFLLLAAILVASILFEYHEVERSLAEREEYRRRENLKFLGLGRGDSIFRSTYFLGDVEAFEVEPEGGYRASLSVDVDLEGCTPDYLQVSYTGGVNLTSPVGHTIYVFNPQVGWVRLASFDVVGSPRVYGPYTVADPQSYVDGGFLRFKLESLYSKPFSLEDGRLTVRFAGRPSKLGPLIVQNTGDVTLDLVAVWEVYGDGSRVRRPLNTSLSPGELYVLFDLTPEELVEVKVITGRGNIFIARLKA